MTELYYSRPCSVCACELDITLDTDSQDITITAHNLEPLAKDKLTVLNYYKRLKGLGAAWDRSHRARGIIYAGDLIRDVGTQGGALERAVGLMEWLQASRKDWSLDNAATYLKEYTAYSDNIKNLSNGRCLVCGESFVGKGGDCGRHD